MLLKKHIVKTDMFVIMDAEGNIVNKKYMPKLTKTQILDAYKTMVLSRVQDERMLQWQRQGRMLTFPPSMGQEAIQMGAALALRKQDWLAPAFRSNVTWLAKGWPMSDIMLFWNGNEMGSHMPEGVRILPVNVPIGTQFSHAVGLSYAAKLRKLDEVALAFIGDGGTSEGEFYEAMNFAGNLKTPTIFVIQNNQYAISTSRKKQTTTKTLAQKAIAAGLPHIQVDGNDVFAVYTAINEAREQASAGQGPSLIECVAYRFGPHTTADNPSLYREKSEEDAARAIGPILRLKKYLINSKLWDEDQDVKLYKTSKTTVNEAYKEMEAKLSVNIDDVFRYTYKELTPNLKAQLEEAKKIFNK